MSRIIIQNMSFSYKSYYHPVFTNITLNLDTDWRLGVIGRNGRGKTTFLKLLSKDLIPDAGFIEKSTEIEFFSYEYDGPYRQTLDVIKECVGNYRSMEEKLEDPETLYRYLEKEGFSIEGKIKREMKRMGFHENLLDREFHTLSGGEKTKVLLIAMFLKKNTFILLDEPTNHLDIKAKKEVADYLKKKKGFMVVSHDREFINEVVDHILAINKAGIKIEKGNYTSWKRNKDMIEEYELRTKNNINKEIKNLEGHALKKREWASVSNIQKYHFASNSRTNGVQSYNRQAKKAELQIENDIMVKKKLLLNYEIVKKLEFQQAETEKDWLVKVHDLSFSYRPEKLLLENISFAVNKGDAVWIKGPNGSGKSTLLKLISGEIPSPDMRYNGTVQFAYLNQEWNYGKDMKGIEFLKVKNTTDFESGKSLELCKIFDLTTEELEKPFFSFSSGEKKKIELAKILCRKNHVLILDEPLNYMDIEFREQLESAILAIRPTIIFVEHDICFGKNIATKVVEL